MSDASDLKEFVAREVAKGVSEADAIQDFKETQAEFFSDKAIDEAWLRAAECGDYDYCFDPEEEF